MRKGTVIAMVLAGFLAVTVGAGWASLPVSYKGKGCVIHGTVYSIYNSSTVYRYELPSSFNLKPYEGKKVKLEGMLSPGDFFVPKRKKLRVLGLCDKATRKLIRKTEGK